MSYWPAIPPPVRVHLTVLPERPCPYLPDRMEITRAAWASQCSPSLFHAFLDAGFRRSGKLIYQPACRGCRACQPIRVPTATFRPSKSQRRCQRRNEDLSLTVASPAPTPEKHALYRRYLREWHGSTSDEDFKAFAQFLYDSPVESLEFSYRDHDGRLLAVGICDAAGTALSSVYFYFDPLFADRGLGTYGALREILFARERGMEYYYLGYWIAACRRMSYKSAFRPYEILWPDQAWRPVPCE